MKIGNVLKAHVYDLDLLTGMYFSRVLEEIQDSLYGALSSSILHSICSPLEKSFKGRRIKNHIVKNSNNSKK